MKGIFKKTLACALAVCTFTSSVTAFATDAPKPDIKIYENYFGIRYYSLRAYNIPEVTQYSNRFTFKTQSIEYPCNFRLEWQMYQVGTDKKIGKKQSESAEKVLEIYGDDFAALSPWGSVYADCLHEVTIGTSCVVLNTISST